jgi:L-iditol 2-dehydrogenase
MPDLALGHEYSGIVIDPGASNLKKGDRVAVMELTPCMECSACKRGLYTTCPQVIKGGAPGFSAHGGMGEYSLVRPDMVVKLPDSIDDILGALIEPASIGMHSLKIGRL